MINAYNIRLSLYVDGVLNTQFQTVGATKGNTVTSASIGGQGITAARYVPDLIVDTFSIILCDISEKTKIQDIFSFLAYASHRNTNKRTTYVTLEVSKDDGVTWYLTYLTSGSLILGMGMMVEIEVTRETWYRNLSTKSILSSVTCNMPTPYMEITTAINGTAPAETAFDFQRPVDNEFIVETWLGWCPSYHTGKTYTFLANENYSTDGALTGASTVYYPAGGTGQVLQDWSTIVWTTDIDFVGSFIPLVVGGIASYENPSSIQANFQWVASQLGSQQRINMSYAPSRFSSVWDAKNYIIGSNYKFKGITGQRSGYYDVDYRIELKNLNGVPALSPKSSVNFLLMFPAEQFQRLTPLYYNSVLPPSPYGDFLKRVVVERNDKHSKGWDTGGGVETAERSIEKVVGEDIYLLPDSLLPTNRNQAVAIINWVDGGGVRTPSDQWDESVSVFLNVYEGWWHV